MQELHVNTNTTTEFDTTKPASFFEDREANDIAIANLSEAIRQELVDAYNKGRAGWNRPDECRIGYLIHLFDKAVQEGNTVKIGVYLMMLHGRGVTDIKQQRLLEQRALISEQIDSTCQTVELLKTQMKQPLIPRSTSAILEDTLWALESEINQLGKIFEQITADIIKGA